MQLALRPAIKQSHQAEIINLEQEVEKRRNYFKYVETPGAQEAMSVLRLEMYNWHHEYLAEQVGVSVSCIMAIRSGRTKWPRPHTFFGLLRVLGLAMYLKKV